MTTINHHIDNKVIQDYAIGRTDECTALVVACHLSLCDECRAEYETSLILASSLEMAWDDEEAPLADLETKIFASIESKELPARPKAQYPYPQPLVEALGGRAPKWRRLAPGISQSIIAKNQSNSVRLLRIDPNKPVPEHSHKGQELTLVLQGAFRDEAGTFQRGDVETADSQVEHQPIAFGDVPCICLASTTDSLVFKSLIPRLLQPAFQI